MVSLHSKPASALRALWAQLVPNTPGKEIRHREKAVSLLWVSPLPHTTGNPIIGVRAGLIL